MRGGGWSLARLCLLGLLFLPAGCAEPDLEIVPPSPLSFEELKERVARIRGLSFQVEVSLETAPAETIRAFVEKSLQETIGKENLQQKARVYARLGLLPEAADLSRALLDLRLSHQGDHDARGTTIFLPKEPLRAVLAFPAASSMTGEITRQLLLIQELSYILQNRHFHWEERIRNRNTEDSRLTLRALKKGDAVLVALAYLMGGPKEDRQKIVNGVKVMGRLPAQIDREFSQLPELLRQKLAFQYLEGSEFVSWAYSLRGWEGVNALFQHPPLSTRQILHPEKFYLKREEPVRITPWGLIRQLGGEKIIDETLGEFLIRSLLGRSLSKGEARQAAAGWAGDSLLVFQQGEELVLGWVTAWDNQGEAREFYGSFRRALERRHAISLEPSPSASDTLISPAQSGRSLLLQIRDHFVLLLDGVPAPRSVEIAEGVWNDLETGTEPAPLDLAQRSRQFRSVSR